MKLCRCGAIVKDRCERCNPKPQQKQTTKERGYGWDHQQASTQYRAERPLCECCVHASGVIGARPTTAMHHIHKIRHKPELRMQRSNWLAVCDEHHEQCETDVAYALNVKQWSDANYENQLST